MCISIMWQYVPAAWLHIAINTVSCLDISSTFIFMHRNTDVYVLMKFLVNIIGLQLKHNFHKKSHNSSIGYVTLKKWRYRGPNSQNHIMFQRTKGCNWHCFILCRRMNYRHSLIHGDEKHCTLGHHRGKCQVVRGILWEWIQSSLQADYTSRYWLFHTTHPIYYKNQLM